MKITSVSRSLLVLLCLAISVIIFACNKESPIIGRWKEVNGTETISFLGDNSVEVNSGTTFSSTTKGTFEHPDKSHVRISMKGLLGVDTKTFEYKIKGDQMTLTELNGNSVAYSKVKD